ncbi:MarR family protein [uncultured archaeon]|nr:MarR family protein [uncultured archaeon]
MKDTELDCIADHALMFFPLFHRRLAKGEHHLNCGRPSRQQYQVLGMTIEHGPLPVSEIGRRLCVSKPNMTTLVEKLVKEGKVKRFPDKKDRRIVNIAITEGGKRFMKERKKLIKKDIKRNLSSLSDDDLKTLWVSLENVRIILSKIDD